MHRRTRGPHPNRVIPSADLLPSLRTQAQEHEGRHRTDGRPGPGGSANRRSRDLRDHGRSGEGDDLPLALPAREARPAGLPDRRSRGGRLDGGAARRARARVDRGHRRGARRGGLRASRRAALVRPGGLLGRRDVRARRQGDRRQEDAGLLSRDPAVPLRDRHQGAGRGWADQDGARRRREAVRERPEPPRTLWRKSSTSTWTSPSSSGSTTTSGRWGPRRSSTCGSRTPCWSRSGTGTTSRPSRSRWPRTSASRTAATSTIRSGRCATSWSITSCRWSPCARWRRRRAGTRRRSRMRRFPCSAR